MEDNKYLEQNNKDYSEHTLHTENNVFYQHQPYDRRRDSSERYEIQNNLKRSLRDLYLSDIERKKMKRNNERLHELEEERKQIEQIERQKEFERERKIKQIQEQRNQFFKEYHQNLNQNEKLKQYKYSNFFKPNEIFYEPTKSLVLESNQLQQSNPLSSRRYEDIDKEQSLEKESNKDNIYSPLSTETRKNPLSQSHNISHNSKYALNNGSRYLVATPYNSGNYSNIYSIHKNYDYGKNGFQPNNFFLDNKGSLNEIVSKKRTYIDKTHASNLVDEEYRNKQVNTENNPYVYSNVSKYWLYYKEYDKELRISRLQKQQNYKNGLDYQIQKTSEIRQTPSVKYGPENSQYKWYFVPNDPRKINNNILENNKNLNIGNTSLKVNPIVNPGNYNEVERIRRVLNHVNRLNHIQ